MEEMSIRAQIEYLVANAAALWNGGGEVLMRVLDDSGHDETSPAAALHALSDQQLHGLFETDQQKRQVTDSCAKLRDYLKMPTWFDKASLEDTRLQSMCTAPVAYFCAEFGIATWLPIYSGGLGVLAGDMLKEASDMGVPFVGVGLFYKHGFFHQKLDDSRYQTQVYDTLDPHMLGLTPALDILGNEIVVEVPVGDRLVSAAVWTFQVGRVTLYLLDTDIPANVHDGDRTITGGLYAGGSETRVQQELVLGIGGVRVLRRLGIQPSIYSMNEGHAAFLAVELLAECLSTHTFENALQHVRRSVVYTNHTVVPAGNDIFAPDLIWRFVGPYAEASGIGSQRLIDLAMAHADSGFSMARLAFQMSGRANAVSHLHAEVIPREWPGFPVEAVTNGVHIPTWLGTPLSTLFDRYGVNWRSDAPRWEAIRTIPDRELLAAHHEQRRAMIIRVNEMTGVSLDANALTLVWARRFAEYKRAFLIASDIDRLNRLLSNPERPVQLIISGKAHPADESGKWVLRELLQKLDRDDNLRNRVAFVEDYNLDIGRMLAAGADVWLNTPRKPLEASGTSGMKSSDNGCIQLTVTDGWAAEVDWWGIGWGIAGRDDVADRDELYDFLENGIIPTHFNRDADGVSAQWAAMMKNSMITTLSRFSSRRMLLDYLHKLYLPLIDSQQVVPVGGR